MTRRDDLILFLAALLLAGFVAFYQHAPGYMDADYYLAGALRLWQGEGFTEVVLWNYLDDPAGFPHPSHGYWMPLASLIAVLGMPLSPWLGEFNAAQLPFLVIAGAVAPLTGRLAYSLSGQRWQAWLAGGLAVFPGFYVPFHTTTDTFGLYMLLGALFFLIIGNKSILSHSGYLLVGCIAGLMHLARADGLLWLLVAGIAVLGRGVTGKNPRIAFKWALFVLIGYLLIMGPWLWRNFAQFGTPLSPGGARVLWMLDYDELFSFPATILTPARWWSSGWRAIGQQRIEALINNVVSMVIIQGAIVLFPLIVLGLWALINDMRVRLGLFASLVTLILMTFVFPAPGWRGGFFHSSSALQPLWWAVAPVGLDVFVRWWGRWRKLALQPARVFFSSVLLGVSLVLVGFRVYSHLWGQSASEPVWSAYQRDYQLIENALQGLGAENDDFVLVNNPPGYFITNQRPGLVLPDGDAEVAFTAAEQFGAEYMILDINHGDDLRGLYAEPMNVRGWRYVETINEIHIFEIER